MKGTSPDKPAREQSRGRMNRVLRRWARGVVAVLLICTVFSGCTKTDPSPMADGSRPNPTSDAWTAGTNFRDCSRDCPELVVLPPMRSAAGTAAQSFAMGKYEVTVAEFRAFVKDTGHALTPGRLFPKFNKESHSGKASAWDDPPFGDYRQSDRDPVTCVSWAAANDYVKWLARKTGKPYALPSQEQWEYAAQGGAKSRFFWGEDPESVCDYANTYDAAAADEGWASKLPFLTRCRDGYAYTAPVGSFRPNGFGLFDTVGNVAERTTTCFFEVPPTDPPHLDECGTYVARGGGWIGAPSPSDASDKYLWNDHLPFLGFRVMRWRVPPA